ncbi:GNAT family N-acetyltransferase [Natronorubrum texcoconense]|uniref:Protein N-acetyltransferase, RimJ/RimL family n=1 Tax=Natronorubrum texcoconense TaxID=1095776 RepID=A0A1G9C5T3_9EURY|nr:GNAT family protein [Natronorubrum texcoconense]SDK47037.1 Protein N-acetyltransferase, RimJ/RimL family [Natronorubrum texcoconense]
MADSVFLSGDRIDLRPIEEDDLGFLQREINDPRIWRAIGRPRPVNGPQERAFFENVVCDDDTVNLLIVADSSPVGTIAFNAIDWETRQAEIGYWVAPEHHGQGYGTDAAARLVAYGFDQLGLHKITARVFEFNEASRRLLESVGFTREGVHRDDVFVDGAFQDTYWYGLLEDEWRSESESE